MQYFHLSSREIEDYEITGEDILLVLRAAVVIICQCPGINPMSLP